MNIWGVLEGHIKDAWQIRRICEGIESHKKTYKTIETTSYKTNVRKQSRPQHKFKNRPTQQPIPNTPTIPNKMKLPRVNMAFQAQQCTTRDDVYSLASQLPSFYSMVVLAAVADFDTAMSISAKHILQQFP